MKHYSEEKLTTITGEITEALEAAHLGREPWALPAELFSAAFPGGFAALINQDFVHDKINFMEWANLNPESADSYVEHFAYINPWADVWTKMPSGSVFVAEKHRPARTFSDSEFYNDWLIPQGDIIGGVGLRVDASPTDVVYFPMHYPSKYADVYDAPAAEVSRRLTGTIERIIGMSDTIQRRGERLAAHSSLIARGSQPAIVVDSSMRLTDANSAAVSFLSAGHFMRCKEEKVVFQNRSIGTAIARHVADLCAGLPSASLRQAWHCADEHWAFTFAKVPSESSFAKALLSTRPQVLILMRKLTHERTAPDLREFARIYGLTPAETRLCSSLAAGRTLSEAATETRISYGTARGRIKAIFQKTGTRRQAELCVLLEQYRA